MYYMRRRPNVSHFDKASTRQYTKATLWEIAPLLTPFELTIHFIDIYTEHSINCVN